MFGLIKLLFTILILAVIGAFVYLNVFFKSDAEEFASSMTGTKVSVSYVSLSPTLESISIGGLSIGNPKGFKSDNAIEFGSISAEIDTQSVLTDTIKVKNVTLESPVIYYEIGVNGDNLRKLVSNVRSHSGGSSSGGSSKEVIVENLYLNNGKVVMAGDFFGYKAGEEVEIDNIHLKNIGTGGNGTSPSKVTEQVLEKIISQTMKAKTNKLLSNPDKVIDGLKDLF